VTAAPGPRLAGHLLGPLAERLATYVVLDADTLAPGRDLPGLARAVVVGGAGTVQVRAKRAGGRELYDLVVRVAAEITEGVLLLVNDRVDVAAAARLAGLPVAGAHVGRSDLPPVAARAVLGPGAVLGFSAGTADEVRAVAALPAGTVDYLGISPIRVTPTKPDAGLPVGAEGAAELVAATVLPCVGIGGLSAADAGWMRRAGLAGTAVVSAVSLAADPQAATGELAAAWRAAEREQVTR
jgi:thiamine-phosphate pyrophosphorylase